MAGEDDVVRVRERQDGDFLPRSPGSGYVLQRGRMIGHITPWLCNGSAPRKEEPISFSFYSDLQRKPHGI